MEPMAGIEPATDGLRNRCSTTELHWLPSVPDKLIAETPEARKFQRRRARKHIPKPAVAQNILLQTHFPSNFPRI